MHLSFLTPSTSLARRILAGILTLAVACSAARSSSAATTPLISTAPGATWHYEVREQPPSGTEPSTLLVRIVEEQSLGARNVSKVETLANGSLVKTELIAVDDAGLRCYSRTIAGGKTVTFDPPQTMVPAVLKPGTAWEFDDQIAGSAWHERFAVIAEEPIEVPAGTYHAVHVRAEQPWPVAVVVDRWFAPGIGLVKDVTTTRGPNGRLVSRVTTALQKFTQEPVPVVTPTPPAAPPANATARPAPPKILLEVASDREGAPQTEFTSDRANIFVRWAGEQLPRDVVVRVAWVAEDVGDIAPPNFVVDETRTTVREPTHAARFTLSRPQDGWAVGKYRVDLFLGDQLVRSVRVSIHD